MSLNSQFSLALELSSVFPIRPIVDAGITRLMQFARDLRKSGSDIVVEEDLASVFGRGNIDPDLEDKFKKSARLQAFVPLSHGSEIRLDSGPGPTIQRALKDRRYLATVMQLSLLAWMQSRSDLARMLSEAMKKRVEDGVRDASNPGYEGIAVTLSACSSQTSSFAWSFYVQEVEIRLRNCFPDYQFHQQYTQMPENVLLGAMDYLYLLQSLPEQRKVVISNQAGCITIVVWAHYLLSLTVMIFREKTPQNSIIFKGSCNEVQLTICWQECTDHSDDHDSNYVSGCQMKQTDIRLLDSDTSVILQVISSQESNSISALHQDRHPLLGYGSATLHRMLNSSTITPENDPIYEDSVKLITALAIHVSSRLCREFLPEWLQKHEYEPLPRPLYGIKTEVWRVLAAAKVIFSGVKQHPGGVASYVEHLAVSALTESSIPLNFQNYLKTAKRREPSIPHERTFLKHIQYLARVVLLFSYVIDIESCAEMPIVLHCTFNEFEHEMISACRNPKGHPLVLPHTIFFGLVNLLSDDQLHGYGRYPNEDSHSLFLCSDFGWSVFLGTIGDKDPEDVRPYLIHVKKGVPTDVRTNERKSRIIDGVGLHFSQPPRLLRIPPQAEHTVIPSAVAQVVRRREYWTTHSQHFELALLMKVEPTKHSVLYQFGFQSLEVAISCRVMHEQVWETYTTPSCDHQPESAPSNALKMAPDALAIMGWNNGGDNLESGPYPQRVLVLLSRGDPRLRWLAVINATRNHPPEVCDKRNVMLRTRDCCDTCALEHVFSLQGRWILIL